MALCCMLEKHKHYVDSKVIRQYKINLEQESRPFGVDQGLPS